jgi:hypothetical protein
MLLHSNDIYDLDAYGWIDADTHDPKMVGHAMHQVDSLSGRFLQTALASPNPPQLEGWQKSLVISGGDFEGLMKATRLSIGLMLFQNAHIRGNTDESDSFFPLHLMSSMILLGSASDRLRDFFIAATVHKATDEYEKGQKRRSYTKPFHQAIKRLQGPLSARARSLCALAVKIETFRRMRHEIVHVISTELGRREQRLVNEPPSRTDEDPFDFVITDEVLQKFSEEAEVAHRKRISYPMDWYRLLIRASNDVFIIENTLRNAAAELPTTEPQGNLDNLHSGKSGVARE